MKKTETHRTIRFPWSLQPVSRHATTTVINGTTFMRKGLCSFTDDFPSTSTRLVNRNNHNTCTGLGSSSVMRTSTQERWTRSRMNVLLFPGMSRAHSTPSRSTRREASPREASLSSGPEGRHILHKALYSGYIQKVESKIKEYLQVFFGGNALRENFTQQ